MILKKPNTEFDRLFDEFAEKKARAFIDAAGKFADKHGIDKVECMGNIGEHWLRAGFRAICVMAAQCGEPFPDDILDEIVDNVKKGCAEQYPQLQQHVARRKAS